MVEMAAVAGRILCWRLERPDGAGLALTSHDQPVERGGLTYRPSAAISPSSVEQDAKGGSDSEIAGAICDEALRADDLALGRWTGSRARLTVERWDEDAPGTPILAGELGDVRSRNGRFEAAVEGLERLGARPCCPVTTPQCRAELGDRRCRVDLAGRRRLATVIAVEDATLTLDIAPDPAMTFGRVRLRSGSACGWATVALAIDGARVHCRDLCPAEILPGARIELTEGCDKRLATCHDRFANAANFRGEPHLPGTDLLTRYPGG